MSAPAPGATSAWCASRSACKSSPAGYPYLIVCFSINSALINSPLARCEEPARSGPGAMFVWSRRAGQIFGASGYESQRSGARCGDRRCTATLLANVRFGSKADIRASVSYVRFTPESGRFPRRRSCPLSAKSGHSSNGRTRAPCASITGH